MGRDDLRRELQSIFATKPLEEWVALAAGHDIAMGPAYRSVVDAAEDPHLMARGTFHADVHPVAGPYTFVKEAGIVAGQPYRIRHHAPALGAHSREVLAELGFAEHENERSSLPERWSPGELRMIEPVPSQGRAMADLSDTVVQRPAPSIGVKESHRVAIIQDWGVGLQPLYDQYDATQLAFDEATEPGLLDRPVELKVVEFEGLPYAGRPHLDAVEATSGSSTPSPSSVRTRPRTCRRSSRTSSRWASRLIARAARWTLAGRGSFLTPNGTFSDEGIRWSTTPSTCRGAIGSA